jgi:thymidylate synthase
MKNYHDLMAKVLSSPLEQVNERTGELCRYVIGEQIKFDVSDTFPAITTKRLAFNSVKGELLGFFRGYTSAAKFRELGCNIWNDNANKTKAWLDNPYREGEDHLGPIYGKQWKALEVLRIANGAQQKRQMIKEGFHIRLWPEVPSDDNAEWLMQKFINQLESALHTLLTNPSDRRIIANAWNVGELDMMALPPCHMSYEFTTSKGFGADSPLNLHVTMKIRSWDLFLGGAFNISSTALFLEIMARLAGMNAASVTIQGTNIHLYANHFEQTKLQLSREHLPAPMLWLSEAIKPIGDMDEIKGAFERIEPHDIELLNYQSLEAIKAPMAA